MEAQRRRCGEGGDGREPRGLLAANEFTGPIAADASGHGHDAVYERDVAYYLEGPHSASFCANGQTNRAPHLVGARVRARLGSLGDHYTVSMWCWNGMPNDGRDTSGWLFSRSEDHGLGVFGDHLGIGGKSGNTGRLIFFSGSDQKKIVAGKTEIPRWKWQQVTLVRDGAAVRVYLNGRLEIETNAVIDPFAPLGECFFGGRSDNDSNWEGRIDEVAVFNRALSTEEVAKLVAQ